MSPGNGKEKKVWPKEIFSPSPQPDSGLPYITLILGKFPAIRYKKEQLIYISGTFPSGIFYVKSGKVKIYTHFSNEKEQIIRIVGKGEFIGYASLLSGCPYSTSAQVTEDAELSFIPQTELMKIVEEDKIFSAEFMKLLCGDLQKAEQKLTDTAFKQVRGRFADCLIELHQQNAAEGKNKPISISRMEMAQLIGTTKETVARFISEFREEMMIRTEGRKIFILNIPAITRISHLYN